MGLVQFPHLGLREYYKNEIYRLAAEILYLLAS